MSTRTSDYKLSAKEVEQFNGAKMHKNALLAGAAIFVVMITSLVIFFVYIGALKDETTRISVEAKVAREDNAALQQEILAKREKYNNIIKARNQ